MFVNAIDKAAEYTRPLHIIRRRFFDNAVFPDSGTLFFVNDQAWALTAKHIAALVPAADQMEKKYRDYVNERAQLPRDASFRFEEKLLAKRSGYERNAIIQLRNTFVDCVEGGDGFTIKMHPKYDLALIHFNNPANLRYRGHAVFAKEPPKQGQTLCRLGYPFPEYTNFRYNADADTIEFTREGNPVSPRFPLDGMVTRFLRDDERFFGIELSTPGPMGQAGAPLFDENGLVYGMQYSNKCVHLGIDVIDKPLLIKNEETNVSDYGFLRLGLCIHQDVIKDFMRANDCPFEEA